MKQLDVGVLGAGLAGLAAARELRAAGHRVVLFDKGRRPGGRCAARGRGESTIDHGAQYFTARDAGFVRWLAPWIESERIAAWPCRLVKLTATASGCSTQTAGAGDLRYVAVPDMNALPRALAEGLEIKLETRIVGLERIAARQWHPRTEDGRRWGPFDALIVTLPAPQAAELLSGHGKLAEVAARHPMSPCWAAWFEFDGRPAPLADFDGAFVEHPTIAWLALNGTKPGRSGERLVVHATPDWSSRHGSLTPPQAAESLFAALQGLLGALPQPRSMEGHRWGFAAPLGSRRAEAAPSVMTSDLAPSDPAQGLYLAGDAYAGGRVEGAVLSGLKAAQLVLEQATGPRSPTR